MVEVTKERFFAALNRSNARPRPERDETFQEIQGTRKIVGESLPGYLKPGEAKHWFLKSSTRTTAIHREEARAAEKHGEWGRAVDSWQAAIDSYPDRRGALAKRDIERMEARLAACRAMCFHS